jgi:hypothetical protein
MIILFRRDVQVDRVWVVALVGCGVNGRTTVLLIINMLLVQLFPLKSSALMIPLFSSDAELGNG